MLEWNILQDDNGMFGRILFQQVLEVRTAGAENHLMGLGMLTLGGDGHVTKRFLISQVLERGHHVGLEIIPSQAKLLIIRHLGCRELGIPLTNL